MFESALDRRRLLTAAGGGALAMAFAGTAWSMPANRVFNVSRKGSVIGTHAIEFVGDAESLKVANRIELAVKIAFVTAYRYEQRGEDEWRNDVLVRTRIETNDDGENTLVVAESRDGKLAVQGPNGSFTTPLGAMTDISFWNQAITRGAPVIDSQSGDLIDITIKPSSHENLDVLGKPVETERFPMVGTRGRSGTVWYDLAGNLVRAIVVTRGETLTYELAA
ncbi:MAG: DUF6134 family protein [Geminicoccaceae bacterium]